MYYSESNHHDIAVVGTGFAGLAAGIALKRAGRDFVICEKADDVGGTWRDNTYPGCGCDVPTPLYSLSSAPNPGFSHFFARQGELWDYMDECFERFSLREHVRFGAEVTDAVWDEPSQRWQITLGTGEELSARFLIGGFGGLAEPRWPEIPGLETFSGELLHSAKWDHSIGLEGKRVAVIGTGASSIQLTPQVAKVAGQVDVFQRTPAWVIPKLDLEFGPRSKWVFRNVPGALRAVREGLFWITEGIGFTFFKRPEAARVIEGLARNHLRTQVRDPEIRAKLTPDYTIGCKRMLVSNDYYPAFNRENVSLVTDSITEITADGLRTADGKLHPADVLVCSTGFDIEAMAKNVRLTGRGGVTIREAWADGIRAHRGTMVHGFPNAAILSGPNSGSGSTSQVFMIEHQVNYLMRMLGHMDEHDAAVVEVTAAAEQRYNEWLQARMENTVWSSGCRSWYLDENGRNRVTYPGFSTEWRRAMSKFRPHEHTLEPARVPAAA